MSNTIRITNPAPGGSSYTTAKKAAEYIRQGRARLVDSGHLEFISRKQRERDGSRGWDYGVDRGAMWWNGSDRSRFATHRPGEVVS